MITFVGTGGVGKTSLSLAVALLAAQSGRRVAAVTVDPSQRLFRILNPDASTSVLPFDLNWPEFQSPLSVYPVDVEKTFNEFITTQLGETFFKVIAENKIYRQISKNLRETHNFAALYQMYNLLQDSRYDLIVLDTPPCHQVLEFFQAPERLSEFFSTKEETNQTWVGWVQKKSFQAAESLISGLIGQEFLKEMEVFLFGVQRLGVKVREVSDTFVQVLRRQDSKMVLIFSPAHDKVEEALFLNSQLTNLNYRLDGYLLNRAFSEEASEFDPEDAVDDLEKEIIAYFKKQKAISWELLGELANRALSDNLFYALLPEMTIAMEQSKDLLNFAQQVQNQWKEREPS